MKNCCVSWFYFFIRSLVKCGFFFAKFFFSLDSFCYLTIGNTKDMVFVTHKWSIVWWIDKFKYIYKVASLTNRSCFFYPICKIDLVFFSPEIVWKMNGVQIIGNILSHRVSKCVNWFEWHITCFSSRPV